jgi:ACS family D-galactonate transporter-like MFS transporter
MGIVAPIVTGFIVLKTGSLSSAFVVRGVVLIVGMFSYVFVLGRIEPVPDLTQKSRHSPYRKSDPD